jgi:hypothetical protein
MLKLATKFAPQPAAFETAYRAGFRFAELWLGPAVLADWQTVVRQASDYPFGYALHFPNRLDLSPQALEQTVALYRALNSRCLVIHQPMADKYQQPLLRLEPGLRLAVENHKLSPEGFLDWASRNDGLALDVEHLWRFTLGNGPLAGVLDQMRTFLDRFGPKVRHVHLPGYWPGLDEHRPMYCAREMIFPVLSLLDTAGFEGLVVSEVNPQYQNRCELRMDVLLFEAWRESTGPLAATLQEHRPND